MVFPDSSQIDVRFLILWKDQNEEHFEWCIDIEELKRWKKILEEKDKNIIFAGEIAILKDLTNIEK